MINASDGSTAVFFCTACRQLTVSRVHPERCPHCCRLTLTLSHRIEERRRVSSARR
jgi:hypothetical protein